MKRWQQVLLALCAGVLLVVLIFGLNALVSRKPAEKFGAAPTALGQPAAVQMFDETLHLVGTTSNPIPVSAAAAANAESVLLTTGATPSNGLAGSTTCHVTSVKVTNQTGSSAFFFLSNGTAVPDAGFTGMIDTPTFAPPNSTVVLGNDHFGQAGLFLDAGCAVGVSGTGTSDGGGGAGPFTSVTKSFDISVYGYTP